MYVETGILPPALASMPELAAIWELPQYVWTSLNGSRTYYQGGLNQIPFSEFFLWCLAHGIPSEDCPELWKHVHTYDMLKIAHIPKPNPAPPKTG